MPVSPQSSYKMIYMDKDLEQLLTQSEMERRFEHELHEGTVWRCLTNLRRCVLLE